ncbi:glycosyltransferase [Alkaliflexus imshenetskii]|uniref:glycosyltransferase n=1 Tax=Alkaliflexus imshenetskii TaxID=286730 RepID=UPI0006948ABA|nr:glycosyltransferase [Alkaliflexus imshenetskii]
MKILLTASLVLYRNPENQLIQLLESLPLDIMALSVIDNSPDDALSSLFTSLQNVTYNHSDSNLGFGKGHNKAFECCPVKADFHIVLNPDVYFKKEELNKLVEYLQTNTDVGVVGPKVFYPDGRLQFSCRLLPTPIDLFVRRSMFRAYKEKRNEMIELRFTQYNKTMEVPFVLGCFMTFRTSVFAAIGGFDERYFLYLEDVDICRRVSQTHRVMFYPHVSIFHVYAMASRNHLNLTLVHLKSAFKYFNKWGWLFDRERKRINNSTLKKLKFYDSNPRAQKNLMSIAFTIFLL